MASLIMTIFFIFGLFVTYTTIQSVSPETSSNCVASQFANSENTAGSLSCAVPTYGSCPKNESVIAITSSVLTCALSLPTGFVQKTAQSQIGTGLTTSNTFFFIGNANFVYYLDFSFLIVSTETASSGINIALSVPAGANFILCTSYVTSAALADEFNACTSTNVTSVGVVTLGTTVQVLYNAHALVNMSSTVGTVHLFFSSGTALRFARINVGSIMELYRIA